jgi:uncharacterized protein YerC
MAKISRYNLEDKAMVRMVGQLWDAFTFLGNRKSVKKFLSKFFTPTEIQMLAKRLELIKLADSELEVSQLIRLTGLAKVTVYEWLDKHDSYAEDFHIVIDRLKKDEKDYLQNLKEILDKKENVSKLMNLVMSSKKIDLQPQGYTKRKKRQYLVENLNN